MNIDSRRHGPPVTLPTHILHVRLLFILTPSLCLSCDSFVEDVQYSPGFGVARVGLIRQIEELHV